MLFHRRHLVTIANDWPPAQLCGHSVANRRLPKFILGLEMSLMDVEAGGYQLFDELIYRTRLWPRTAKAVDDTKR
jgi:hypothetical protein